MKEPNFYDELPLIGKIGLMILNLMIGAFFIVAGVAGSMAGH